MPTSVSLDFSFCAGHRLVLDEGKCSNIHGHNYKVRLIIEGQVGMDGKVIDFGELKKIVKPYIETTFDHKLLLWEKDSLATKLFAVIVDSVKDSTPITLLPENPTAENISIIIANDIGKLIPKRFIVREVRVEETDGHYAIYNPSS